MLSPCVHKSPRSKACKRSTPVDLRFISPFMNILSIGSISVSSSSILYNESSDLRFSHSMPERSNRPSARAHLLSRASYLALDSCSCFLMRSKTSAMAARCNSLCLIKACFCSPWYWVRRFLSLAFEAPRWVVRLSRNRPLSHLNLRWVFVACASKALSTNSLVESQESLTALRQAFSRS